MFAVHVVPACQVLGEVIKAGATTLNIPDTTGWNLPHEFGELIAKIKKNTPGADNIIISTHCQNDLGLSTANSLAGAMAGRVTPWRLCSALYCPEVSVPCLLLCLPKPAIC